jgi:sigma-B regulation protein RsbU (phosphoserine phosphatase)
MHTWVKVSPGQAVPIAIASAPVVGPEARIVGATTVFRDISEQLEFVRNRDILYQREHHIADVLQRALIQDTEYEIPGLDIAVRYEPALSEAEVGGDFYDIFDVGDNKVGILVGDVAGKGLAAAVRVAAVRHAIRSYAFIDPRPGRVMSLANNALCRDRSDEAQMVTAIFAVVDTAVGTITYSSGGHEPVQLRRADGTVEGTDIGGRVLGVLEDYDYPESSVRLQVDDTVLIFTDGITEARPDATHLFGAKGVSAYLSEHGHRSTEAIAAGLLDAAKAHSQGGLRDDVAIVCIRLKGLGQLRAGR